MRDFSLSILVAACSLLVAAPDAQAQSDYPVRPVHLLVGSAVGGTTDLVARVISTKMGEILGQAVVVDNRPGANQTIAAERTARAVPDGYTVIRHAGQPPTDSGSIRGSTPFSATQARR